MVEDMDEAAVYGSPMYRLLEEVESTARPASRESEMSDGREDDAVDEATARTKQAIAAEGTVDCNADSIINLDREWELFRNGKTDARSVLAVLVHIYGDETNAWWPLVLATLPSREVSISCMCNTKAC